MIRGTCVACGGQYRVTNAGAVSAHLGVGKGSACYGSGLPPGDPLDGSHALRTVLANLERLTGAPADEVARLAWPGLTKPSALVELRVALAPASVVLGRLCEDLGVSLAELFAE